MGSGEVGVPDQDVLEQELEELLRFALPPRHKLLRTCRGRHRSVLWEPPTANGSSLARPDTPRIPACTQIQ